MDCEWVMGELDEWTNENEWYIETQWYNNDGYYSNSTEILPSFMFTWNLTNIFLGLQEISRKNIRNRNWY